MGLAVGLAGLQERSNKMNEQQRVPNLEELDEQQAHHFLTDVFFADLSPDADCQANHPEDYVMEMPQSGERIRGRENMRKFHQAYPNTPSIRLRRVLVREGLWVVEGVNDYGGGQATDFAMIIELKDGRIWRDRRYYYAEPFEAPEWRAGWVERAQF
jgi:hypothetical protein